jgi:hypothetical protein
MPLRLFICAGFIANCLTATASRPDPLKATVVAKGEGYCVHCFLGSLPGIGRPVFPGVVLTHTSLTTGEMKFLQNTGTFEVPAVRIRYTHSRVLGITHDDRRLYVLVWTIPRFYTEHDAALRDDQAIEREAYDHNLEADFVLFVYWLHDGSEIYRARLHRPGAERPVGVAPRNDKAVDAEGVPLRIPKANTAPGPLELRPNGFACYGVRFTFVDKKLEKHEPDSGADGKGQ